MPLLQRNPNLASSHAVVIPFNTASIFAYSKISFVDNFPNEFTYVLAYKLYVSNNEEAVWDELDDLVDSVFPHPDYAPVSDIFHLVVKAIEDLKNVYRLMNVDSYVSQLPVHRMDIDSIYISDSYAILKFFSRGN